MTAPELPRRLVNLSGRPAVQPRPFSAVARLEAGNVSRVSKRHADAVQALQHRLAPAGLDVEACRGRYLCVRLKRLSGGYYAETSFAGVRLGKVTTARPLAV